MKVTELNAETNFKTIEFKIVIEDKTDLIYLWLVTNLGTENIARAYQDNSDSSARNLNRLNHIKDYINDTDKSHLWNILNEYMKKLGL